jgi:hypothetical protein
MSAINFFERGVLLGGDKEALVSEEGSYTYNELNEASIRLLPALLDGETMTSPGWQYTAPTRFTFFLACWGGFVQATS